MRACGVRDTPQAHYRSPAGLTEVIKFLKNSRKILDNCYDSFNIAMTDINLVSSSRSQYGV